MFRSRIRSAVSLARFALVALPLLQCNKKEETDANTVETAVSIKPSAEPSAKKPEKDPNEARERRKAMMDRLKKKREEEKANKPVATVAVTPDDPEKGEFTLEEATQGLPKVGQLVAEIHTDSGTLSCDLYEDKAPITVANFVGLARGLRPWKKGDSWVKRPLYDGTPFHRVIKGFMVQGGDPAGNGSGGPGFVIPDEVWTGAKHDQRGLLCMANRGPNTNGSQFFILDGAARHLDSGYTIFGMCTPETVIEKLSSAEVTGDKSVKPAKIKKVLVKRDKSRPGPAAATSAGAPSTAPSTSAAAPSAAAPSPAPPPRAPSPAAPDAPGAAAPKTVPPKPAPPAPPPPAPAPPTSAAAPKAGGY